MTYENLLSNYFARKREEINAMPDDEIEETSSEKGLTLDEYFAKLRDDIENDRCKPVKLPYDIGEAKEEAHDIEKENEVISVTEEATVNEEVSVDNETKVKTTQTFIDKYNFTLDNIFESDEYKDSFIKELGECGSHSDVADLVELYHDRHRFAKNNSLISILSTARFVDFIYPYLKYSAGKRRLREKISDTLNERK